MAKVDFRGKEEDGYVYEMFHANVLELRHVL